jgi:hypothetical protein
LKPAGGLGNGDGQLLWAHCSVDWHPMADRTRDIARDKAQTQAAYRAELGGHEAEATEDYGRPQFHGRLVPATVAVDGDRFLYAYPDLAALRRFRVPTSRLLADFVTLTDPVKTTQLLMFARRWGPLRLCREHQLPAGHARRPGQPWCDLDHVDAVQLSDEQRRELSAFGNELVYAESLNAWRKFAAEARALLRLADELRNGHLGRPDDWRVAYERTGRVAPWWRRDLDQRSADFRGQLKAERNRLMANVREWLELGRVGPWPVWTDAGPQLEFGGGAILLHGGGELFAALAWQLALGIGRRDRRSAICSGCGEPYSPQRYPSGTYHYCPQCKRNGVAERDRKRRQRAGRARQEPTA